MIIARAVLGAIVIVLLTGSVARGGDRVEAPAACPVECGDCVRSGPRLPSFWPKRERSCESGCCAAADLGDLWCPFEIYLRGGPALITGGGQLAKRLETGYAIEGGIRGFSCDDGCRAAWTTELGIDYVYNNSDDPNATFLGGRGRVLRELDRTGVHVAGGRELYFGGETEGAWKYFAGVDGGGRISHISARFNGDENITDTAPGVFFGVNAGVIIPTCSCHIVVGGRGEWGHDWIKLRGEDAEIDQVKLLLSVGVRY